MTVSFEDLMGEEGAGADAGVEAGMEPGAEMGAEMGAKVGADMGAGLGAEAGAEAAQVLEGMEVEDIVSFLVDKQILPPDFEIPEMEGMEGMEGEPEGEISFADMIGGGEDMGEEPMI